MSDARPIGSLAKAVVEFCIAQCDDPVERKERILHAREIGLFSDAETADWLAIYDVRAA